MRLGGALALLLLCAGARAQSQTRPQDFERYSVLTPPGPDEPPPELLAKSRRLLYAEHRVRKGENSAAALAKEYGTTLSAVQSTNNNEYALMYPGMRMTVLNRDGQLYEVRKASETLDQVVARFQRGAERRRLFKELVVRANALPGIALLAPYELDKGARLLIPGVKVNFDTYRFPFESQARPRISSPFGYRFHPILHAIRFHEGLDIPKPYGTPVYPARSGRVIEAGWHEGYGELIEIRHSNGESTRYGHLSKIYVRIGQIVQRGRTMIGRVGSTGLSTGPHLHFEVRDKYGNAVNPMASIGHATAVEAKKKGKRRAKR
ncbi:MAG TPA: M23 family metallopeptidase [Elusimicrobiota bacterium]|jgi:murein DD-endopeptidase MepM/ murein hydrolase activator NlpD|nr:M23 family metallopeptidase [Elusimicrobiota bacterium]